MRWRLDIGYDGTHFHGWAPQPGLRTVAGVVADALDRAHLEADVDSLTCAGRTDAGVHAVGQVAHVDIGAVIITAPTMVRRMNALLPDDVVVNSAAQVPQVFDARFAAIGRTYEYRVADTMAARDPRERGFTWQLPRPGDLDLTAMNRAAASLVGEHDFAAYCKWRAGASTVRELTHYSWRRHAAGVLVATVRADAFCHAMVRSLVGAVVAVGQGRRPAEWPATVLAAGERSSGIQLAPAHGLSLVAVEYPSDDEVADRIKETRRVRGPVRLGEIQRRGRA